MTLYERLFARFMAPEDDGTSGGGGGAAASAAPAVDEAMQHAIARGDFIPDPAPAAAAAPAAATEQPAAAAAAGDPAASKSSDPDPAPAAAPAAAAPAADPGAKDQIMVPKSRLDEVLAQVRELKEQVKASAPPQATQQPKAPEPTPLQQLGTQMATLQEQYESALLDGDVNTAKTLRGQIQQLDDQRMQLVTADAANTAAATVEARTTYANVVNAIAADYPQLFPENAGTYNAQLERDVAELRDAYTLMGRPAHEALAQAVSVTMRANGIEPASKQKAADPAPAPAAEKTPEQVAQEKIAAAEAAAASRKQDAVARNVDALKATPPNLNGVGAASDAHGVNSKGIPDVAQMSEAEFEAMRKDPAKMALARGDLVQ